MRSRKELIYLNIKDLTEEEKESLGDMDLNCCDKCGQIDLSENLIWLEDEFYYDDDYVQFLIKEGFTAVCDDCLKEPEE